jgi:pimeloyl-ACP methyl ester carboxylesterase
LTGHNLECLLKKYAVYLAAAVTVAGLVSAAPALGNVEHASTARTTPGTPAAPIAPGTRAAPTARTAGPIHWGSCAAHHYPGLSFDHRVKCAALKVPLDYNKPRGATITLALSRLPHSSSAANYQGVMLSNPGGPGGSGLSLGPALASAVPHGVGHDYDWVSWDPRGVGSSKPAIHCQNDYFAAPRRKYDPTSKSLLSYWLKRSKSYADACEKRYPTLLRNMTTIDSAKDMNFIRKALGVSRISYYGYSYGTYLGQVYSTLYPNHLKRMVLDSNVDPRKVWYQANLDQDRAFDRNIHIYFGWVAKYHAVYHLGSTQKAVSRRYYKDLATLAKKPDGRLGPDEWADALESAAYYRFSWEDLARAWASYALKGHPGPMIQQYVESDDPGNDNEFAVYNAVQCTDTQWPTKWSRWKRDNDAYNKKYPFLTWGNAWFNAPCLYWGAKAHTPIKINGKATKSVLLIDETLDAATPYAGSLEVRKLYPHSSLIAEPGGTTHADSLDGDSCVDDLVATYLRTGHRPARKAGKGPDATCKPLPDPHPSANGDGFARGEPNAAAPR